MKIEFPLFQGIRPRLAPHLLADTEAQRAVNTKLWSGPAEPFRQAAFVATLPPGVKRAIYRHGQSRTDENFWMSWPTDVDVARGPVAGDTQERIYYTGDGVPKVTDASIAWASAPYPSASYTLGLPAPTAATITSPGGTGTATRISLVYIYVSAWGETGPPSPASNLIDYFAGQPLTVSGMDGAPSGAFNVATKFLYIAATDANGTTAFRFWRQVPVGTASTSGTVDFALLGEAIASPSLVAPPTDLFGLRAHPGGFLVGCTTRRFCRSEVFKPYGWPTLYQDPLPDDIVGCETLGSGTVICTKGKTYLFTGVDPLNQQKNDLDGWQPCVSKRAISRTTAGVIYPSPDGLVLVSGGGPLNVVTANHITRERWQTYRPETSHAAVHDDRYYWWWDNGTARGLLIFEFGQGTVQQIVESDVYATAAFADHRKDDLYLADPATGNLFKWDSDAASTTLVWRSKLWYLDRPQNIGAVKIEASGYPVTFRLYSGGVVVNTVSVTSDEPQTLRGDRRYKNFFVEVEGAHRIDTLAVGSSIFDLR